MSEKQKAIVTEEMERITNMINEGGIGVSAHYSYDDTKKKEQSPNKPQ